LHARSSAIAALVFVVFAPTIAWAHERWVHHRLLFPVDRGYFRSMSGDVLRFSLMASLGIAGIVTIWYLFATELLDRLMPATQEAWAREKRLPIVRRTVRAGLRFVLDADLDGPVMEKGEKIATLVFAKIPAFVLALGAHDGWLFMPSFPLEGALGNVLRVVEGILAVWVLWGKFPRALGAISFAVFVYLCFAYGIAAIDAIPVLASAFFYYFAEKDPMQPINRQQLFGMRLSLGVGFFLLGLINKIYLAPLFIGVGDQFPQLIAGPRHMFPGLTREAWSFTTALGEMMFGLLLLIGIFDKLTTLALALIFTNFIFTFGWAEIVHLYPIAGFMVLFFRAPPGTALDGAVFRTHVRLWRAFGHRSSPVIYPLSVMLVALGAGTLLMFLPLFFAVHIVPRVGG
jgi:uncharacterized membrane protein YphA (DoxX/SURF4 family)